MTVAVLTLAAYSATRSNSTQQVLIDRYPNDTNDNIQSQFLCSLILEAPHAVLLVVPICSRCRMHASSALSLTGCLVNVTTLVLDYCAIHDELVL